MEENERAVAAMRQFLEALGLDLQALGMEKTPHRVAQAFADFFSGLKENPDDEWQDPIATQTDGLVWRSTSTTSSTEPPVEIRSSITTTFVPGSILPSIWFWRPWSL